MVTLTKKFSIKPTKKQENLLWELSETCRLLYNHALAERKFLYNNYKHRVTYIDQQNALPQLKERFPRYKQVYSKVLQMTLKKVDAAYKSFFGLVKNGENTARSPKFRGNDYFFTLCYNQSGFSITYNTIKFSHKNPEKVELIFSIPFDFTSTQVKQVEVFQERYDHQFYVAVAYEQEEPAYIDNGYYQAFDLGIIKHTAINSSAKFLETVVKRPDKYWQQNIRSLQQRRDHCLKNSRRHRLFSQRLRSIQRKSANQTKDWQHKQSKNLIQNTRANTLIVGDLSAKKMASNKKNGKKHKYQKSLHRGVHNTGHLGRFVELLTYKAKLIGKRVIVIDERATSKTCAFCGHKKERMPLSERTYHCEICGIVIDRDQNSAINIMKRFLSHNALCTGYQQFISSVDNLRQTVYGKTKVSRSLVNMGSAIS
ncbi:MAG: RNA-guided endonuclease InsQ/TnpB family protein [Candidatus Hodarchaeales archaeon]|jgi:putative transposase